MISNPTHQIICAFSAFWYSFKMVAFLLDFAPLENDI
jgi:hypothetical protein